MLCFVVSDLRTHLVLNPFYVPIKEHSEINLTSEKKITEAIKDINIMSIIIKFFLDRHDIITKNILQLDPWENEWTVVVKQAVMHDSYDVCLVANLNPRGLMPPPADLVDE